MGFLQLGDGKLEQLPADDLDAECRDLPSSHAATSDAHFAGIWSILPPRRPQRVNLRTAGRGILYDERRLAAPARRRHGAMQRRAPFAFRRPRPDIPIDEEAP
jgi:hypothetical protein